MDESKKKYLDELARCVLEMEDDTVKDVAREYIDKGFDAYSGIADGLSVGMNQAGQLFEEEEYFVPELLLCSDAMNNGMDILKPYIRQEDNTQLGIAVIGVVEGDTHDIGKNLVKIMMESAGFTVYDLGRDVSAETFIEKTREYNAQLVMLSTMMTTTMHAMKDVIELLEKEGLRENVRVMIGGGPISQAFADQIGADAYTANAAEAVKVAKQLIEEMNAG